MWIADIDGAAQEFDGAFYLPLASRLGAMTLDARIEVVSSAARGGDDPEA